MAVGAIHGTVNSTINGVDGWAEKAIAGRPILIDLHGVDLDAIMKAQSIQSRVGDILLLRTGCTSACLDVGEEAKERLKLAKPALARTRPIIANDSLALATEVRCDCF